MKKTTKDFKYCWLFHFCMLSLALSIMLNTRARTQSTRALGGRYRQCVMARYCMLGVEQRDRITHYAGDRYTTMVKYGDYGLKFRDFPKLTAMWR